MIQAELYADIEIAKAVVTKYAFRFTNLDAEFTDLLLMLLYYAEATNCTELYFRSVKVKSNVYNIKVRKKKLGETVCCNDLLFIYSKSNRSNRRIKSHRY